MKTVIRETLRGMVDPCLIGEISKKPIEPMQVGKYLLHREAAWRMLILQTVLPFARHQIKCLKRYRVLLTNRESRIADQYSDNIIEFGKDWRSHPFSFPETPDGFEEILLN